MICYDLVPLVLGHLHPRLTTPPSRRRRRGGGGGGGHGAVVSVPPGRRHTHTSSLLRSFGLLFPIVDTPPTDAPPPHSPKPLHTMPSFFSRFFGPRRYSGQWNEDSTGPTGAGPTTVAPPPPATAAPFDYMPLPKERIASLKGVFSFDKWVGVSVVQWFYVSQHIARKVEPPTWIIMRMYLISSHMHNMQVLFYCLVGTLLFLSVAQALLVGSAGIAVMYLILSPIFFLLFTMAARIICELVISVLMVRVVDVPVYVCTCAPPTHPPTCPPYPSIHARTGAPSVGEAAGAPTAAVPVAAAAAAARPGLLLPTIPATNGLPGPGGWARGRLHQRAPPLQPGRGGGGASRGGGGHGRWVPLFRVDPWGGRGRRRDWHCHGVTRKVGLKTTWGKGKGQGFCCGLCVDT